MKKHLFYIYSPPESLFFVFTSHRRARRTVERENVNSSTHLRPPTQPNTVDDDETIISNHWDGPPTLVSTQFAVFGLIEIMSYPIFPSDPLSSSPAALDSIYWVYFCATQYPCFLYRTVQINCLTDDNVVFFEQLSEENINKLFTIYAIFPAFLCQFCAYFQSSNRRTVIASCQISLDHILRKVENSAS